MNAINYFFLNIISTIIINTLTNLEKKIILDNYNFSYTFTDSFSAKKKYTENNRLFSADYLSVSLEGT